MNVGDSNQQPDPSDRANCTSKLTEEERRDRFIAMDIHQSPFDGLERLVLN
ncbi:hypothetical protein [Hoeflea prorocentri]|uniref:Uncharacterized protein n=1 Tax=Hoeflea prorocentri TaxID=1922333 RepID=A0A9X3UNR8_9HYPH|nr:hypothetical protein [Hoeflea prorocentri]MCY6382431.1 hypothetical protein [Hoeflea prorocentri]MDA5400231.1 hypothetical protein [Hoeflea prorocentri]